MFRRLRFADSGLCECVRAGHSRKTGYTQEIKNGIEDIVDLAAVVNSSMKESEVVVKEFSNSFSTVREKAEQNRASVLRITNELDKFVL